MKDVYILKVDNRPRTDGLSKYLGILYLCISYEANSGRIIIVSDGQKVYDFIDDDLIKGDEHFPAVTLRNLKIMSRSKDGHSGIFGMMTDLLAWENSTWELANLFKENLDRAGLCTETDLGSTIVPLMQDFEETQAICSMPGPAD